MFKVDLNSDMGESFGALQDWHGPVKESFNM